MRLSTQGNRRQVQQGALRSQPAQRGANARVMHGDAHSHCGADVEPYRQEARMSAREGAMERPHGQRVRGATKRDHARNAESRLRPCEHRIRFMAGRTCFAVGRRRPVGRRRRQKQAGWNLEILRAQSQARERDKGYNQHGFSLHESDYEPKRPMLTSERLTNPCNTVNDGSV